MTRLLIMLRPYGRKLMTVWIISILILSSLPSLPTPKVDTGKFEIRFDYLIHFFEYASLTILAFLSFVDKEFIMPLKKSILITVFLIIFAFLDEFHQKLIPGRAFNPKDIISNISGIMASIIFICFMFRKMNDEVKDQ